MSCFCIWYDLICSLLYDKQRMSNDLLGSLCCITQKKKPNKIPTQLLLRNKKNKTKKKTKTIQKNKTMVFYNGMRTSIVYGLTAHIIFLYMFLNGVLNYYFLRSCLVICSSAVWSCMKVYAQEQYSKHMYMTYPSDDSSRVIRPVYGYILIPTEHDWTDSLTDTHSNMYYIGSRTAYSLPTTR